MKFSSLFLVALIALKYSLAQLGEDADTYISRFLADLWLEGADVVKIIWRDCSKKLVHIKDVTNHTEYYPRFTRCMKKKTLRALDRSLNLDVVPITDGVNLVKFEMVDWSGNVLPDNKTSTWTEKDLDEYDWRTLALQRIARVLRTHVIKFDFDEKRTIEKDEQRGRRRMHMMTMMMFGIVSIGMVLIPMGFQFLAVLGGKALLLAKMALILASIQGLKKIASSPLNYGFYHYPPYDHLEKRSNEAVKLPWKAQGGVLKTNNVDRASIKSEGKSAKQITNTMWDPMFSQIKNNYDSYQIPEYSETIDMPMINTADIPTSLIDITQRPGEVQADYTLELPHNGLHFQSPTSIISA